MIVSDHQQRAAARPDDSAGAAAQSSPDLGFAVALAEPVPSRPCPR